MPKQWSGLAVASCLLISIALALTAGCIDDAAQATDAAAVDARNDDAAADAPVVDAPAVDAAIDATPVDAPIDGIRIDADPSACTIDGVYATDIGGMPLFFRFDAGTSVWAAALTEAGLTTGPIVTGTFTFAGVTFTIVETPPSPCPATQTGQYTVAFSPTCDFTLTLVSDACVSRSKALDGLTFTQP